MFEIGKKVICIDASASGLWTGFDLMPVIGPYYKDVDVIRGFDIDGHLLFDRFNHNCGFNQKHFVLLDESFAEGVLGQIKEQIEQEELVTI